MDCKQVDWVKLSDVLAKELDIMIFFKDVDCYVCKLNAGQHTRDCPIAFLIEVRKESCEDE